ncbi:polymer-forming cytoskeletal protein [Blastomonas sp.]|uniref:bactofilin family protein n=1 Tax=Blastomonas sp. TaxID=1909299 RepID=UPI003593EC7C
MAGNSTFSVIGTDVVITGNISAKVDLHIDGRVEGDITCASLVQGEGSTIKGAVVAETARISGTLHGSIEARDLVIAASAEVTGDVTYETISIEQGGHVDGRFQHKGKTGLNGSAPATTALHAISDGSASRPALPLSANQVV